jgi:hypothetical protein
MVLSLAANGLHAQAEYMLTVREENKTITFTTAHGTTSQPDTITMETGRYSGRYRIFFDGAGSHFFKVIEPTDKWIKMAKHSMVKLIVVFSPPASFKGETLADLRIHAPAGVRAIVHLKGTSTE